VIQIKPLNRLYRFFLRRHREILLAILYITAATGFFARNKESLWISLLFLGGVALMSLSILAGGRGFRETATGRFMIGLTAALVLNFLIQRTGGLDSTLWSGYFVLLSVAAFWQQRIMVTGGLLASVLLLEAANLAAAASGLPEPSRMSTFLVQGMLLTLVSAAVGWLSRRQSEWAVRIKAENERIRNDAVSLGNLPVGEQGKRPGALSRDDRHIRWMGASRELDERLSAILALAAEALEADNCGLFLVEGQGDVMLLRQIHPPVGAAPPQVSVHPPEGLIGGVAKTASPVILGRLEPGDQRISYPGEKHRIRSFAAAPVIFDHVLLGVIFADSERTEAFREKKSILTGFADQAAEIVFSTGNVIRKEEEGRKHEALVDVSQALSSSLKRQEIMDTLLERSAEMIGFSLGAFFLKDSRGRMVLEAACGLPSDLIGKSYNIKRGFFGHFISGRGALIFDDLDQRKRTFTVIPGLEFKCRSLMAVPVVMEGTPSGVFLAGDPEPALFDSFHLNTLKILANQASILLANASLHERMEKMAITDGLTGLCNHRHFHERLEQELARVRRHPEPLSVLLLDVDHFKRVNDSYGHPFGDVVLRGIARLLSSLVREVDVVARYGGEEMAILLVNTDVRGAEAMAGRIMKALRKKTFHHQGEKVTVTASLGSATCPADGQTSSDIIRAADEALYRSKGEGRDRYTPAGRYREPART
jgi:diguanylate cyclase (GGDEF)-like protein